MDASLTTVKAVVSAPGRFPSVLAVNSLVLCDTLHSASILHVSLPSFNTPVLSLLDPRTYLPPIWQHHTMIKCFTFTSVLVLRPCTMRDC